MAVGAHAGRAAPRTALNYAKNRVLPAREHPMDPTTTDFDIRPVREDDAELARTCALFRLV